MQKETILMIAKWGGIAALVLGVGFYIYVLNSRLDATAQTLSHTQENLKKEKALTSSQRSTIADQEETAKENAESEKILRDLIAKNHQKTLNKLTKQDELIHDETTKNWLNQPLPDSIISLHNNPETAARNQSSAESLPPSD